MRRTASSILASEISPAFTCATMFSRSVSQFGNLTIYTSIDGLTQSWVRIPTPDLSVPITDNESVKAKLTAEHISEEIPLP